MRVELVGTYYEPYVGGIETYMRDLAHALVARGVEVGVTCLADGPSAPAGDEVRDGVRVRRIRARGLGEALRWPGRLVHPGQSDVLHFNGFSRPLLLRLLRDRGRTPWTITLHGGIQGAKDDPVAPRRWAKTAFDLRLARAALGSATRVICVRESEAKHLRGDLGMPKEKIVVWPNFVPGPGGAENEPVPPSGRLLVLARLSRGKRIGDLVRTLAEHPELPDLDVAGPAGDDSAALRELAGHLRPGRLRFLGPVDGERKAVLVQASKALILPSDSEGHSLAALEALAAGTPVIASTGAAGGLDPTSIWTFPVGDRTALASRIRELDDPAALADLRRGMAAARRSLVDREDYVDRLLALYWEAAR